jgi:hypothetical protein
MSYFSITLFSNKNNFVTKNSKKIHVHIVLKTFISILKQNCEFPWVIENQNISIPIWHQGIQPFKFETRREGKLAKLQHHINTQILLIFFKYIYTIKLFKI